MLLCSAEFTVDQLMVAHHGYRAGSTVLFYDFNLLSNCVYEINV